ncbi:MAG: Glutamine--fructose-6-phosphate aminotransferase (isomerizing) [Microgenomates bacterium OLB23]|nr:MAG: Glutamine--fructose-6-phosphate aminotransferase (isomerizing) [Microgenomates bacterium OLB23]
MLAGSNAICVLNLKNKEIGVCRDGSPVAIGLATNEFFIGSDVTAFLPYTRSVVFLEDGQGAIINKIGCKMFSLSTKKALALKSTVVDWKAEAAQKDGYPHYLLKEIMEQLVTIPKTAHLNKSEIKKAAEMIKNSKKIVLTGCGTASFCALAAKYLFAQQGVATEMCGAYESAPTLEFASTDTVVIAISQSGETADTLLAIKRAQKKGAKIIAVINARGSTLERIADVSLMVGSGPEIAVVSTKAFTAQLATLYRLAGLSSAVPHDVAPIISKAGSTLKEWLNKKHLKKIARLAAELHNQEHLYVLGKDLQYPAAMECALKVKEASYIHGEAFSSGELKHGVIALVDTRTPCIVLGAKDAYENEVRASAAEVKARGGYIIGIAPFEAPEFDITIKTPNLGPLTILANVIVGQLLGYYCAIGRGADPDKPRNLAKSVTVK